MNSTHFYMHSTNIIKDHNLEEASTNHPPNICTPFENNTTRAQVHAYIRHLSNGGGNNRRYSLDGAHFSVISWDWSISEIQRVECI